MWGWGRVCAIGGYVTGVLLACVSGLESIWLVRAELGGRTFAVEGGGEGVGFSNEDWSFKRLDTLASIEATCCKRSL